MQIVESTPYGVRSAVRLLEADEGAPAFILFPMAHVADAAFYEAVAERLLDCDVILYEGVGGATAYLLTASYRFFANSDRLRLVLEKTMDLEAVRDRLIHADVSEEAFQRKWSGLPLWLRISIPIAAPLLGFYLRFFGTRDLIAARMGVNLRKSEREILQDDDLDKFESVLIKWRDRHLLKVLDQQRCKPENAGKTIGVVFGARHMRAVYLHLMRKHGYRITSAEWMTVIALP